MPGIDRDGGDLLLIWAALHFELPAPGASRPLVACADQPPPSPAPRWYGESGLSSALWEAPIAYERTTTEVHVRADACAPAGKTCTERAVGARVGSCIQEAVVFGERRWTRLREISRPLPFDRVPLVWERAFGGSSVVDPRVIETRNPIGAGIYASAEEAVGQPLPQIEHPRQRITGVGDRPPPVGFLPRGTGWEPRVRFAGTYDEAWAETRCPLWPRDFDERFFLAAPPALVATRRFVGGEPVALVGMDPRGDLAFALPSARVIAEVGFRGRSEIRELELDIVSIDVIAGKLSLIFRETVPAHRQLETHVETVVRLG
nr:DUF2169 domain-containing protein [Pseudenhygromyxa sp. WMMC2535]